VLARAFRLRPIVSKTNRLVVFGRFGQRSVPPPGCVRPANKPLEINAANYGPSGPQHASLLFFSRTRTNSLQPRCRSYLQGGGRSITSTGDPEAPASGSTGRNAKSLNGVYCFEPAHQATRCGSGPAEPANCTFTESISRISAHRAESRWPVHGAFRRCPYGAAPRT